jgi:hypothetical protein
LEIQDVTDPVFRPLHRVLAAAVLAIAVAAPATAAQPEASTGDANQYRQWIAAMKASDRGPFSSIKWFCKDGRLLAPKDYACAAKGQGWQHGEWNDRAKQLRAQGYRIATLLAGLDANRAVADKDFPDFYAQLLVEKFLVAADDGWVLRKARFYRGAVQEEDEREGARNLLTAMAAKPEWIGFRYPALRTAVRQQAQTRPRRRRCATWPPRWPTAMRASRRCA